MLLFRKTTEGLSVHEGRAEAEHRRDVESPGFYFVPSHVILKDQKSSHNFSNCFHNNKTGEKIHANLLTCPKGVPRAGRNYISLKT